MAFSEDLEPGALAIECRERDLPRIRELAIRYADLPLGFADAAVVAVAERYDGKVLSLDHHFRTVAREGTIRVLPQVIV